MKAKDTTALDCAYFIRQGGKVTGGGVVEFKPHDAHSWAEHVHIIKEGPALDTFVRTFHNSKAEEEAMILTSPKYPGIELILPPNTEISVQMVAQVFPDIAENYQQPRTIPVRPNPTKS